MESGMLIVGIRMVRDGLRFFFVVRIDMVFIGLMVVLRI